MFIIKVGTCEVHAPHSVPRIEEVTQVRPTVYLTLNLIEGCNPRLREDAPLAGATRDEVSREYFYLEYEELLELAVIKDGDERCPPVSVWRNVCH